MYQISPCPAEILIVIIISNWKIYAFIVSRMDKMYVLFNESANGYMKARSGTALHKNMALCHHNNEKWMVNNKRIVAFFLDVTRACVFIYYRRHRIARI